MTNQNKNIKYTVADIEKYHKGLLSPREMHDLEKAALDDPFLADAIEGYKNATENVSGDVADIRQRLYQRVNSGNVIRMESRSRFKWWKVAAAILILGGLGYFAFRFSRRDAHNELAQKVEVPKLPTASVDSDKIKSATAESTVSAKKLVQPKKEEKTDIRDQRATQQVATSGKTNDATKILPAPMPKDAARLRSENTVTAGNSRAKPVDNLAANNEKKLNANVAPTDNNSVSQNSDKFRTLTNNEATNYFRGRVMDVNNRPLPFANVTATRDSVGTYADAQGYFTLISPDTALNVEVRSVGFENRNALLNNNVASNTIVLNDDRAAADRIVSYKKADTSRTRNGTLKVEEPEPADGWTNYDTYIANNLKVPEDIKSKQNTGEVKISFDVSDDGSPTNFRVEKSLCQKCDIEAIRLIKQGPKWKYKGKKNKRVSVTVPFDSDR